jgi:hypothetical protein
MSEKVFSDILFKPDLSIMFELLHKSLLKGLSKGSHGYRPDPLKGEFRASQAPYCSVKLVFHNILNWQVDSDLGLKANGGTLIHLIIQELLLASGLKVVNEDICDINLGGIKISGHMDIVLLEYKDYLICIDIKTMSDFGYLDFYEKSSPEKILEKGWNDPKKHHSEQLIIYLYYLRKKYRDKTVIGYLWYLPRVLDEQILFLLYPENWRIFFVAYQKETWDNLVCKLFSIYTDVSNGILPKRDAKKFECSNKTAICQYLTLCFSETAKITTIKELLELKAKRVNKNG